MVRVIVDSSILIEELRQKSNYYWYLLKNVERGKIILIVPTIVISELWAGKSMAIKVNLDAAGEVLAPLLRLNFNEEMAKCAGELRRLGVVSDFDSLIAASCLNQKAQLATLNKKHFLKVKGLKLYKYETL